ncbi:acetyl-CoA carboxylase, biotin carboxyl carrier protein [Elysia marginata]|uniref:Biotin carboxyl carrier protein of acetyl-CoA carboxylase n=1 Tax=Elysia marginata TaxID=1093978 RepID=A0AAV4GY95_9GAST|nr:acetyl-CoA carboxylase, biotin carboxyl carrier protein [Elysia marginata]
MTQPVQLQQMPIPTPIASAGEVPKSDDNTPLEDSSKDDKYLTIKSPMIGTFYRKSSPDKPNLVAVGDIIKPGDKLCVVEAMKLFNHIESEISGKIVKVLLDDASPVEFDQPLFLVDPS